MVAAGAEVKSDTERPGPPFKAEMPPVEVAGLALEVGTMLARLGRNENGAPRAESAPVLRMTLPDGTAMNFESEAEVVALSAALSVLAGRMRR